MESARAARARGRSFAFLLLAPSIAHFVKYYKLKEASKQATTELFNDSIQGSYRFNQNK